MDSDIVMLGKYTRTRDAARILRHYERDKPSSKGRIR